MWSQFLLENFHFAINLFAALAFFSVFWLYLDAWIERKTLKEGFKILGFLFLSISFLLHATLIESSSFGTSLLDIRTTEKFSLVLRNLGYLFLVVGLISDPLVAKPKLSGFVLFSFITPLFLSPILASGSAWLYLRRATVGLENHTKKVALAFFVLALHELTAIPFLFSQIPNVDIYRLVAPLGPMWIFSHTLLFVSTAILITWAFSYLLKRINTQLFIIFTTTTLSIFLLTTVSFTFLLLKNISDETLIRLQTDVSVLSFALDSKKSEALAASEILTQNSEVITAVTTKDRRILAKAAEELLLARKLGSLIIIDESGQVLARGEDKDRIGDSLSDSSIVKRVLIGEKTSTLISQDFTIAPVVFVKTAAPLMLNGKVVGAVITSLPLDNNFLDGIKKLTGLEISVYGGDTLSATTISDLRGTARPVGIKNTDKNINNIVLTKGQNYSGLTTLLNNSYFAAYQPLKDNNNEVIGMLLAGRYASSIFATASKSIELTFLITVTLTILSVFPSFFIAKYITNQLK